MMELFLAIFVLLVIIAGISFSETHSFFGGTVTLIMTILGAEYIFGYNVIDSIVANPFIILFIILLYVVAGSAYTAFWKWPNYIQSKSNDIEEDFRKWSQRDPKKTFDSFLESSNYSYKASNNKERLSVWVMMWPFSVFWELSHKPAFWLWTNVYNTLGNLFESVGKNAAIKNHSKIVNNQSKKD